MGVFSFSHVFVSFITFFQNIGINIDMPNIQIPGPLKKILTFFRNFTNVIMFQMIPSIPKFDLRAQLVIMSLGIPLILDICVMWFVNPLISTIFHILDLAAAGATSYFAVIIIFQDTSYFWAFGIALGWLFIRMMFYLKKKFCAKNIAFHSFAKQISSHYLHDLIPKMEKVTDLDSINESISSYCSTIELIPQKPPIWVPIIYLLLGCIVWFIGVVISGILDLGGLEIPPSVSMFLPYVLYPLGVILIVLSLLKMTECGVNFIFSFKKFCKRWGLRLLMLALDALYIPILTALVSLISPTYHSCGIGYSLFIKDDPENFLSPYIMRNFTCLPCGSVINKALSKEAPFDNYTDYNISQFINSTLGWLEFIPSYNISNAHNETCSGLCSGEETFRLADDLSLSFLGDVLYVNTGTILFTLIFIMLGIPYLYFNIISKNRRFVSHVNAFGHNTEEKWGNIMSRLNTTGIFLFAGFKYERSYWGVWLLFYKFIIMALSTISINLFVYALYLLPVVYFGMLFIVINNTPHEYFDNNLLDGILFFLNFVFSAIPVLSHFEITIPNTAMVIFTISLTIFPVVSTIFFVVRSVSSRQTEDDPTVIVEFTDEELEERARKIERNKIKKKRKERKEKKEKRKKEREEKIKKGIIASDDEDSYSDYYGYSQDYSYSDYTEYSYSSRRGSNSYHDNSNDDEASEVYTDSEAESHDEKKKHINKKGNKQDNKKTKNDKKERHGATKRVHHDNKDKPSVDKKDNSDVDIKNRPKDKNGESKNPITDDKPKVETPKNQGIPPVNTKSQVGVPRSNQAPQPSIIRPQGMPSGIMVPQRPGLPPQRPGLPPGYRGVPMAYQQQMLGRPGQVPMSHPGFPMGYPMQYPLQFMPQPGMPGVQMNKAPVKLVEYETTNEDDFLPEDYITIKASEIANIKEGVAEENIRVNKHILSSRMQDLYDMIDIILDGAAINTLSKFLTSSVIFAAFAFGWYISAILLDEENPNTVPCNFYNQ